jgi:hypothetical protein
VSQGEKGKIMTKIGEKNKKIGWPGYGFVLVTIPQ